MKRLASIMVASLLGAGGAVAGDIVIPVAARNAPGAYGNLWSTEVYLINPTSQRLQVNHPPRLLPFRFISFGGPCGGPPLVWSVPPRSSLLVSPSELWEDLACVALYVGGLVFNADPGIVIQTRMVNTKGFQGTSPTKFLAGFGEEIPGLPLPDLPSAGLAYLLPTLVWDTSSGPAAFDTYLYFANPYSSDITVTLRSSNGQPLSMLIGGSEVQLPYTFTVPAVSEVQLHPQPLVAGSGGGPALFDLAFSVSAPVAVIGTVVDRASNDSRAVLPIQIPGVIGS